MNAKILLKTGKGSEPIAQKDYQAALDALYNEETDQLVIKPEEFMAFRQVFESYPNRSAIVGNAQHGGIIYYHKIYQS